jgi:hypothetical protein
VGSVLLAALLAAVTGYLLVGPSSLPRLARLRLPRIGAGQNGGRSGGWSGGRSWGQPVPAPVVIDLIASAVDAGLPPSRAVSLVARCLAQAGDPAAEALAGRDPTHPVWGPLRTALDLAARTGLGPSGLLRAAAAEQRRGRARAQALAARRLAVLVLLPTALCLLPAFVVVTVVPLVVDLVMAG